MQCAVCWCCAGKQSLLEVASSSKFRGRRFLIEPNRRVLGAGVATFESVEELQKFVETNPTFTLSADGITLVQPYIRSKMPCGPNPP